jgi:hypothetical protein
VLVSQIQFHQTTYRRSHCCLTVVVVVVVVVCGVCLFVVEISNCFQQVPSTTASLQVDDDIVNNIDRVGRVLRQDAVLKQRPLITSTFDLMPFDLLRMSLITHRNHGADCRLSRRFRCVRRKLAVMLDDARQLGSNGEVHVASTLTTTSTTTTTTTSTSSSTSTMKAKPRAKQTQEFRLTRSLTLGANAAPDDGRIVNRFCNN